MTELAKQPSELAAFTIGGDEAPNPLLMVPPELRKPLGFFWMCFSKLLPSILPIAALLMTWKRSGELSSEKIIEIMRGLTRPERVAQFKFGSDVQCALAAEVTEAIRINRRDAAILARRQGKRPPSGDGFSFAGAWRKVIEEANANANG